MHSFREAAAFYGHAPKVMYMETKRATVDWERMLHKYFAFEEIVGIDAVLQDLRMVKSKYELEMMATSGAIHETVRMSSVKWRASGWLAAWLAMALGS